MWFSVGGVPVEFRPFTIRLLLLWTHRFCTGNAEALDDLAVVPLLYG